MTNTRLCAWYDTHLVGIFSMLSNGDITFRYSNDCTTPISYSLPLDGGWKDIAPSCFLEGLLPESLNERERMQFALGAETISPFDLLNSVDTVGGIIFTSDDRLPNRDEVPLEPLFREDFIRKLTETNHSRPSWTPDDGKTRFSLAGTQGKFTIARTSEGWFWPTLTVPSTHIIKPDPPYRRYSALIETRTMDLAEQCGLDVPARWQYTLDNGQDFYAVERFDRTIVTNGAVKRLRTEDLTQALGLLPNQKDKVEVLQILDLLKRVDSTNETAYKWLEQVAFNIYAGNEDSHAKNYSLFVDENPKLTPLYDSLCTSIWDRGHATFSAGMLIDDEPTPALITERHWAAEAHRAGLDEGRVVDSARRIASLIYQNVASVFEDTPQIVHLAAEEVVAENVGSISIGLEEYKTDAEETLHAKQKGIRHEVPLGIWNVKTKKNSDNKDSDNR